MYVVYIKRFAKNEIELETQIQEGRIYRGNIGMEFGTENVSCF